MSSQSYNLGNVALHITFNKVEYNCENNLLFLVILKSVRHACIILLLLLKSLGTYYLTDTAM